MKKNLLSLGILFAITGCASTPLDPGAEQVRVLKKQPKGCKYLGEATGNQGNFFTGNYTSNANLETGARNDLKNKVFKMGGNAVVILTQRSGESYQSGGSGGQTNVVVSGTALNCPQTVLDGL